MSNPFQQHSSFSFNKKPSDSPLDSTLAALSVALNSIKPSMSSQKIKDAADRFYEYAMERASAHSIDAADILDMMSPEIASNPAAAYIKLKGAEDINILGTQLSHILSQKDNPHLAGDPSNIILEISDFSNQARKGNMTVEEIINEAFQGQEHDASILDAVEHTPAEQLGEALAGLGVTLTAMRFFPTVTGRRFITLFKRAVKRENWKDRAKSKALRDDILEFLKDPKTYGSILALLLLILLITNLPAAAFIVGASAIATMAKCATGMLKKLGEYLHSRFPGLYSTIFLMSTTALHFIAEAFSDNLKRGLQAAMDGLANVCEATIVYIHGKVMETVHQIGKAAKYIYDNGVDIMVRAFNATKRILSNIWGGIQRWWRGGGDNGSGGLAAA